MVRDEWKNIYETYYKQLYLYSLSLVGNKHDAEDLLQETFVKAYLSYTNSGSIKYWLVTVLRNTYLNWQKKRAKEVLDDGDQYLKKAVSPDDLLSDYIEKENRRRLFSEIQKLPVQMKTVMRPCLLKHRRRRSKQHIAAGIGIRLPAAFLHFRKICPMCGMCRKGKNYGRCNAGGRSKAKHKHKDDRKKAEVSSTACRHTNAHIIHLPHFTERQAGNTLFP